MKCWTGKPCLIGEVIAYGDCVKIKNGKKGTGKMVCYAAKKKKSLVQSNSEIDDDESESGEEVSTDVDDGYTQAAKKMKCWTGKACLLGEKIAYGDCVKVKYGKKGAGKMVCYAEKKMKSLVEITAEIDDDESESGEEVSTALDDGYTQAAKKMKCWTGKPCLIGEVIAYGDCVKM